MRGDAEDTLGLAKGPVLAPGWPAVGPEGPPRPSSISSRRRTSFRGLAGCPTLRLCAVPPDSLRVGAPAVDSVGQPGVQERRVGSCLPRGDVEAQKRKPLATTLEEGGAPWILPTPTPRSQPWWQKHLCLCGNLWQSSRHLPMGPGSQGKLHGSKASMARSQENPCCPEGLGALSC